MNIKKIIYILCLGCILMFPVEIGENMQIFGFISQGYLKSWQNNILIRNTKDGMGTLSIGEVALTTYVSPVDKLRLGMQLVGVNYGTSGNFDLKIDWAQGDYRFNDYIGIKLGKYKTGQYMFSPIWDVDVARSPIYLPQGMYPETMKSMVLTKIGGAVYGSIPLGAESKAGDLELEIEGIQSALDNQDDFFSFVHERLAFGGTFLVNPPFAPKYTEMIYSGISDAHYNYKYNFGTAVRWISPFGLKLGATYSRYEVEERLKIQYIAIAQKTVNATNNLSIPEYLSIPVSAVYKSPFSLQFAAEYLVGNFSAHAEYSRSDSDIISTYTIDGLDQGSTRTDRRETFYLMLGYRFTDWFLLSAYGSFFFNNVDDRDGDNKDDKTGVEFAPGQGVSNPHQAYQHQLVLTGRFDIGNHWVMKLECHLADGTALLRSQNNPDGLKRYWAMLAAKTTFHF